MNSKPPTRRRINRAFTLIELLIVVGILALLLAILLPSLAGARDQAKATVCSSNLRQLALANMMYGHDNAGRACPGAADFIQSNLRRWHGTRATLADPFEPADGPLAPYLGPDGAIRDCPSFRDKLTDHSRSFEWGNGGYGYNLAYLGRETVPVGPGLHKVVSDLTGVCLDRIRRPVQTLMFADTAFVNGGLIEYSFAEPPIAPTVGAPATPSIHFRHRARSNVAWTDGHVDQRKLTFTRQSPYYEGDPRRFNIGWFGPSETNDYFDLD